MSLKEYLRILEDIICSNHHRDNIILLEIELEKQNTKINFYYCKEDVGLPIICITELIKKGKQLFYINENNTEILVKRLYNRVIFDELDLRSDLKLNFHFSDDLDVEWAGHPNWFFIVTTLLSELTEIPKDLENYVLKPLFSFLGTGVIFHVKKEDIESVVDKEL
jgi:hypothetical protein